MQASVPYASPQLGLFASLRRLLFGDRAKRAHVSDHGAFMRTLGRAWAVPMTLVFSFGALITLGQHQITILVGQYQRHEPLDFVVLALLAITFVIVGGMDLTLLNSVVELRDARLRGVDPAKDPYTRGARLRVWLVSLIESATFMSVAYQLEKPPSFSSDLLAASVAWGFIVARALIAPICAMYLATLGKRAMVRREMYGNLLLTIGGTIQQILENLQFAADERLIEPLWRMQVLVDRASRATTDGEMDELDNDLLKALGELRHLRDRLHGASPADADSDAAGTALLSESGASQIAETEDVPEEIMPVGRTTRVGWMIDWRRQDDTNQRIIESRRHVRASHLVSSGGTVAPPGMGTALSHASPALRAAARGRFLSLGVPASGSAGIARASAGQRDARARLAR